MVQGGTRADGGARVSVTVLGSKLWEAQALLWALLPCRYVALR